MCGEAAHGAVDDHVHVAPHAGRLRPGDHHRDRRSGNRTVRNGDFQWFVAVDGHRVHAAQSVAGWGRKHSVQMVL